MISRRDFVQLNVAGLGSAFAKPGGSRFLQATQLSSAAENQLNLRDYWNDWPAFFQARVREARLARKDALAGIHNAAEAQARGSAVRDKLWELIGGRFEKTPLNSRTVGSIYRDSYRIDRVIFESQPEVYVTANVYVPVKARPSFPGIISPLGHYWEGKAAHDYQHLFQNLARKGYVVIAFDPFGQGERQQYLDPRTGRSCLPDPTNEHNKAGFPLVLLGASFAQYRAWDAIRALDYLISRPEVDPHRIGCVGHSGGATLTMFLCALEPRIQVAVSVEGHFHNFATRHYDPPGGYGDAEQNIVASLPSAIDRADLLAAFAPHPLLLCYTPQDGSGNASPYYIQGVEEVFQEAQTAYRLMGAEDRIRLFAAFLPYNFDFFNRRETYAWLNEWLGKSSSGIDEAAFDPSPAGALDCTSAGQVLTSLGGRSVFQVTADRARHLIPQSPYLQPEANPRMIRERIQRSLVKLLALPATHLPLHPKILSRGEQESTFVEEVVFYSEASIRVPGWFLRPRARSGRLPAVLYIPQRGKNAVTDSTSEMQRLASKGFAIFTVDLRGLGSCRPRLPLAALRLGDNGGESMEEDWATAGLVLGRPVLGQRVWDFLRCLNYLQSRTDVDPTRIHVLGEAGGGLIALLGNVLDGRPYTTLCVGALADFRSVVESQEYSWGLSWFISGVLRQFDLPDLIAAIAPHRLWCLNTVGAENEVLPESELKVRFEPAFRAFSGLNASERFQVLIRPKEETNRVVMDWLQSA